MSAIRLMALATIDDLREWRWLAFWMHDVRCQLARELGYDHGQRLSPDVIELLATIDEWPSGPHQM
jgi:hypothetical protein